MLRLHWSAAIGLFAGIACSQQSSVELSAREAAADKAAFQAVCGSCHALSLVNGLRTEAEWVDEIQQMVKIGAKGTDEQFDRVMRVLLRTLTKVNVNLANAAEIAPVLDITERTAEALVKYRNENGNFRTLDDVARIAGVDATKLKARKDRILF
jgi:competence protein ComEA